jgi:hypothetical protein
LEIIRYSKPVVDRLDEITSGLYKSEISFDKAIEILSDLDFSNREKEQQAINTTPLTDKKIDSKRNKIS